MQRRDALKVLSLSALALAGASALTACGDDPEPRRRAVDDVLVPVGSDVARADGDPAGIPDQVAALHLLSGAMAATAFESAEGPNVAVSSYSLNAAMALTLNGANGATAEQIRGLFGAKSTEEINAAFNALTAHIEELSGTFEKPDGKEAEVTLDVANQVFGQVDTVWKQDFLDALAASYGARLETLDFPADPAAACDVINAWVAEQTRDKITDLIPYDAITALTRMALVNALYFKAPWLRPFEKALTEDADFHLAGGGTTRVPMMTTGGPRSMGYATGEGWTSVQIAYAGEQTAMTLIVPDAGRFDDVVDDVAAHGTSGYLPREGAQVVLSFPRWKMRSQSELGPLLESLGVTDAFTDAADFSGMTDDEQLVLARVLQQVYVAVDEEGTEAAAATAVSVEATSAPMVDATLTIDRPYLFLIHDVEFATPLFLGRVLDPSAK